MLSSSASEAAAYRGQSPNQIHSGEVSSVKHLRRKSVQRGGVRGGAAFIAFRVIKVPLQSKLCLSSCCYSRVFELRWAEWLTDRLLTPEGWFHIHRSKSTSRSLMIWFKRKKKKAGSTTSMICDIGNIFGSESCSDISSDAENIQCTNTDIAENCEQQFNSRMEKTFTYSWLM